VLSTEIDAEKAITACTAALHESLNLARFQAQLARAYAENQQHKEALEWYRKAAKQGYEIAMVGVGLYYKQIRGAVPKDSVEAMKWFRAAAEKGSPLGQFLLGLMYKEGGSSGSENIPENEAEADKWFRKAFDGIRSKAEQGIPEAQRVLGMMYAGGLGLARDGKEADRWFQKAQK